MGGWCLSQLSWDERQGTPGTGHQSVTQLTQRANRKESDIQLEIFESPINFTHAWRKYPERAHRDTGNMQTHRKASNLGLSYCEETMLTTTPLCSFNYTTGGCYFFRAAIMLREMKFINLESWILLFSPKIGYYFICFFLELIGFYFYSLKFKGGAILKKRRMQM